jgi:ribonuclease HI
LLLCFAQPLSFASSYQAKLCAAMTAIEVAPSRNWYNLWVETDSALVVLAFNNLNTTVVWNLKNRWHNLYVTLQADGCNCFSHL